MTDRHRRGPAADPTPLRSRLLVGEVRHVRHRPRRNAFRYRVWHLLVDVDELDRLDATVPGLTVDRPGPVSLHTRDHFGDAPLPLRDKVARWVAGQGGSLPGGRLLMVAYPRVLGHVFNPVSWWYAFTDEGRLALVIAEVRNTFGDWHAYLLDPVGGATVVADADKAFHVSPFLPVDGLAYRFRLRAPSADGAPDEVVAAHIGVVDDAGTAVLDATQTQRSRELSGATLARACLRTPLVTLRTVALIHWQAARLAWRRTAFHRRPVPPPTGLDALARPVDPRPAGHGSADPTRGGADPTRGGDDRREVHV